MERSVLNDRSFPIAQVARYRPSLGHWRRSFWGARTGVVAASTRRVNVGGEREREGLGRRHGGRWPVVGSRRAPGGPKVLQGNPGGICQDPSKAKIVGEARVLSKVHGLPVLMFQGGAHPRGNVSILDPFQIVLGPENGPQGRSPRKTSEDRKSTKNL